MSESEANADDVFELDRIRRLIELMKEHDLSEIDLRQAEQRIRLCRGSIAERPAGETASALPAASLPPVAAPARAPEEDAHIVYIKSPMVGTFYSRANPNAEAFVRVGDHIDESTTVCIVEAMKVFNEIPAEISGRIIAVLVDDEEPVDFGRPLYKVDTKR